MNAVLNVAVNSWYGQGSDRLYASLNAVGETADRLFWLEQWPPGCLPHSVMPYAFKVAAFREAQKRGYRRALWCDASVWAVGSLAPVWDLIAERGVLLLDDGWRLGQWVSDASARIYGLDRDAMMAMPLCYACVIGVDLTSDIGKAFLSGWTLLCLSGAFRGPWHNDNGEASPDRRCLGHRHDQSAASFLAHQLGIKMVPVDQVLTLGHGGPDTTPLRAEGM